MRDNVSGDVYMSGDVYVSALCSSAWFRVHMPTDFAGDEVGGESVAARDGYHNAESRQLGAAGGRSSLTMVPINIVCYELFFFKVYLFFSWRMFVCEWMDYVFDNMC